MVIKEKDLPEITDEGYPLVLKKVVSRETHSDSISMTWVQIWGHHGGLVCDVSDRAYYIIDGYGEFQVGDDVPERVGKGDYVFIPRGVPYDFGGHMSFLVMNGPAFLPGSDQFLDDTSYPSKITIGRTT